MDTRREEKTKHSSQAVPYSYYISAIPQRFPAVELHWHREIEINHVIAGSGEFICGDRHIISRPGDIVIIPPRMLHAVYPYKGYSHRYDTLVFHTDLLGANDGSRCAEAFLRPLLQDFENICITAKHPLHSELSELIACVFASAKEDSGKADFVMRIALSQLFMRLENSGELTQSKRREHSHNAYLRIVLDYIGENYMEDISVEQLSNAAGFSKSYFMSSFKGAVGISALEYLTRYRIKKVCELLTDGVAVTEAALRCGFNNMANFNRHFKRIMGCTPTQYRNRSTSV